MLKQRRYCLFLRIGGMHVKCEDCHAHDQSLIGSPHFSLPTSFFWYILGWFIGIRGLDPPPLSKGEDLYNGQFWPSGGMDPPLAKICTHPWDHVHRQVHFSKIKSGVQALNVQIAPWSKVLMFEKKKIAMKKGLCLCPWWFYLISALVVCSMNEVLH